MSNLRNIGPVMLVGAGKMGLAMARGWLDAGLPPNHLLLVDPAPSAAARELAEDYGLTLNAEAAGLQLRGGTAVEFSAFITAETQKWAQIIQAANITAE